MRRLLSLLGLLGLVGLIGPGPGCAEDDPGRPATPAAPPPLEAPEPPGPPPGPPAAAAAPGPGWVGLLFRDGDGGVVVRRALPTSPAEAAGLREGDVIVSIDGAPGPAKAADLAKRLKALAVGDRLTLRCRRGPAGAEPAEVEVAVVAAEKDVRELARRALESGAAWLAGRQLESGAFPHFDGPPGTPSAPLTALAVRALARLPADLRPRFAASAGRGAAHLVSLQDERGSVGQPGAVVEFRNYTSALALAALAELDAGRHAAEIARLRDFLVAQQLADPLGFSDYDYQYGAWNYNDGDVGVETLRAEMSITSYVVDGLGTGGLPADHPAMKRALVFLGRAQNLADRAPAAQKARYDGGFAFSPRTSKAGTDLPPSGGDPVFRSYGSATADGLRSLLHAGRRRGDPDVEAAAAWLGTRFEVRVNPGFGGETEDRPPPPVPFDRGILFYYFQSLADALWLYGEPAPAGRDGKPVAWAEAIADWLVHRQQPDGSWSNPVNVMNEDDPTLATAFALLTLSRCEGRIAARGAGTGAGPGAGAGAGVGEEPAAAKPPRPKVDPTLPPEDQGKRFFAAAGCRDCHRLGGAGGSNGPPLDGVGGRVVARFGGDEEKARAWLRDHVLDPDRNPGPEKPRYPAIRMPAFPFGREDADLVARYLLELR